MRGMGLILEDREEWPRFRPCPYGVRGGFPYFRWCELCIEEEGKIRKAERYGGMGEWTVCGRCYFDDWGLGWLDCGKMDPNFEWY